ncbi:DUF6898 family protein [Roseibium sp.]|uniref:DUF6898 family protein n=1 Tax=Roseibium sp. TaxID=1936156 RepID=UPI003A968BB8
MNRDRPTPGEVYLEFQAVGRQVRVTAIDAASGLEVVVFGPHTAGQSDLKALAIRKLQRRLEQETASSAEEPPVQRGKIV